MRFVKLTGILVAFLIVLLIAFAFGVSYGSFNATMRARSLFDRSPTSIERDRDTFSIPAGYVERREQRAWEQSSVYPRDFFSSALWSGVPEDAALPSDDCLIIARIEDPSVLPATYVENLSWWGARKLPNSISDVNVTTLFKDSTRHLFVVQYDVSFSRQTRPAVEVHVVDESGLWYRYVTGWRGISD